MSWKFEIEFSAAKKNGFLKIIYLQEVKDISLATVLANKIFLTAFVADKNIFLLPFWYFLNDPSLL